MLKSLGDRWSSYYDPSEYASFEDALQGRYSGVGLWVRAGRSGVVVSGVQDRSPADEAGLLPRRRDRLSRWVDDIGGIGRRGGAAAAWSERLRGGHRRHA